MKKAFLFILVFAVCANFAQAENVQKRGMFVSVIEDPLVLSSREEISKLVSFAKKTNVDTLFVQIYRSGKAWFPSENADAGPYENLKTQLGEDPLALLIREAHAAGIEVHAWLNMLTLNENAEAPLLKKYGADILTQKPRPEKKTLEDYKIDNQYFLEPADWRVREELSLLVEEVVRAYPELDGLQLDYIRYPDSNPFYGYSPESIGRFKQTTGETDVTEGNVRWKDWRRRQVTELVEILKRRAQIIRPTLQFSTTGCAPYTRAMEECFQDWPAWARHGLADFVTVMTYPPDAETFERYLKGLKQRLLDFSNINIGIGVYKLTAQPEVFAKQLELCQSSGARGCVVFYYGILRDYPEMARVFSPKGESDFGEEKRSDNEF